MRLIKRVDQALIPISTIQKFPALDVCIRWRSMLNPDIFTIQKFSLLIVIVKKLLGKKWEIFRLTWVYKKKRFINARSPIFDANISQINMEKFTGKWTYLETFFILDISAVALLDAVYNIEELQYKNKSKLIFR